MKWTGILLFALFFSTTAWAQYPARSPQASLRQEIGNTYVSVNFARPQVRGRVIFGGLVPYHERWLVTANAVIFDFAGPVDVAGQTVPAGAYALMIVPGPEEWTVSLNSAPDGTGHYDPANDVMMACVPVQRPGRFYESFSVEFDGNSDGATLYLSWADTQISLPFETHADARSLIHIDALLAGTDGTAQDFFRAANYLLFVNKDLDKVLALSDRMLALENDESVWRIRKDVYVRRGDPAAALVAVEGAEALLRSRLSGDYLTERLGYWKAERERIATL